MSDSPIFRSPVVTAYAAGRGDAPLMLSDESEASKTVIRAANGTVAATSNAVAFGSSLTDRGVLIAASRPDEWMLLGDASDVSAYVNSLSAEGHVSVIDWTHGRALFRLTGGPAVSALEKVSGLDWSDAMTPDGAVVSGSVAGVTCDIVRNDLDGAPSYLTLCDRSFGQYLFDALIDACEEFGVDVAN